MFFKDDKGIDVIQFGTGDVRVVSVRVKDIPENKIVGIAFGECEAGKIGRRLYGEGKLDYEVGIKTKLLFVNTKSIDVVIDILTKTKEAMLKAIAKELSK